MALNQFVGKASTPISIALQGEWGSGKTSLMNRLNYEMCKKNDATSYGIWLNTWHYSISKSNENILEEIILALINEVLIISKNEYPEKFQTLAKDIYKIGKNIFRGISKIAVKTAVSKVSSDLADAVEESVFNDKADSNHTLNDLKIKLSDLIEQLMLKNAEKGKGQKTFMFFIDDLDRIEPTLAVKILELLKNIFDIKHCIFVLAIDYDVVVKGLKSKFGELNDTNEREFRSFFDKIIQLPFQMPVSSYNIENYLTELLLSVDYITDSEAENESFIQLLVRFTNLSVGTNPRSIKRLVNTLSFVNLLIASKYKIEKKSLNLTSEYKLIIYALTGLQTACPKICNLLVDNPNIENWTVEFAERKNIELIGQEKNNNIWELILNSYCLSSEYLKMNSYNIISIVKEMQLIAENEHHKLHEVLPEIIDLLSVTSINSKNVRPKLQINEIRTLFAINKRPLPAIESKLVEPLKFVQRKGRMIAKVTYKFDEQKRNNTINISVFVKHNNIYIKIGGKVELFPIDNSEIGAWELVEERGKTEVFNQITADYLSLESEYANLRLANTARSALSVSSKCVVLEQNFQLVTENVEYIYSHETIEILSNFVVDYMRNIYEIRKLDWEPI